VNAFPDQGEQRSSVKVAMNAKGDAQIEVKVYTNATPEEMDFAREQAVRTYLETVKAVRFPAAVAS
jgi:hypothetical protein